MLLIRTQLYRLISPRLNRGTRQHRGAFTLIEILLVLAIIVMVGALATPSVLQILARHSLEKGADKLRVAMGQARVRAIRESDIYAVFILEGGAWYNVAPFSQARNQAAIAAQRQGLADRSLQSEVEDDLLPRGITFAANVVAVDDRAAEVLSAGSNNSVRPILFYPDGTSQDARVVLQNEKQQFMEVQLRGITGLSSTIRLNERPSMQ